MLRYKIKETLLQRGHPNPQQWLTRNCGFKKSKAYSMVHNNQKGYNADDISLLCKTLGCVPNDLFYWHNVAGQELPADHPCMVQLTPPPKINDWNELISSLTPEQILELRQQADKKLNENNQSPEQL